MSKNTYIILVIETDSENHEKRTDECKLSFTKNRVYKSQTNKYILLVKIKQLNELKQSLTQKINNKNCITFKTPLRM